MYKISIILLSIILVVISNTCAAQETQVIYLENPSFEDQPRPGRTPDGWADCGHSQESPPDVQPYGGFNVTRPAQDGRTYIGLVSRDNKTWEAVAQRLTDPLKQGSCYKFSLHACKSPIYMSPTRKNQSQPINFNKGLVLRIWGGNSYCDRAELLDELKDPIDHVDWRSYDFEFNPKDGDYNYICIEAYYKTPTFSWYNGNVLIDNASEIFSCEIPTDPIAINEPIDNTPPKNNPKPQDKTTTPKEDPLDKNRKPNVSAENIKTIDKGNFEPDNINSKDIKVGHKFRLEKLYFPADSSSITNNGEKVLIELYRFLKDNPNLALEIGGHTNGLPPDDYCDRLSTQRAKNVVNYLKREGISLDRMSYKGYGKRQPIGDNKTKAGQRQNQRVEIIITDISVRTNNK
ncbi:MULTISPECIES: OmpA family protein [unclassified Aureispira]|uniref:OmpA family protein n=1 Tax=unclassified Aureispira TaxID=2649989 RepID=UPI000697EE55|nr:MULTISPECIES: OmpA family protein [unclassified Aureispira]WMX12958.1 OmpA family protein [Aureispira sp. CCB-E]